jgi:hypothetical protein
MYVRIAVLNENYPQVSYKYTVITNTARITKSGMNSKDFVSHRNNLKLTSGLRRNC